MSLEVKKMVSNRGNKIWDTFLDTQIIDPIVAKVNELEETGGLDSDTKAKLDEIINNGVSSNLYNPADSAVEIYIDQASGNDVTGDGSIDKPYASIEKAWKRIPYIVATAYKLKFIGNYTINNTLKCDTRIIIDGKGQILITSADIENRSNITSNYMWYFYGINSHLTIINDTSYTCNFIISDLNISGTLSMNNTNYLIKNMDNIKTDTKTVNLVMNNSLGALYNTTFSNGGNNFNVYNNSNLFFANSTVTNPNGVNFSLDFFSNLLINKNCELSNNGTPAKYAEGCTVINNIVTE